jgi:hypothetical protein
MDPLLELLVNRRRASHTVVAGTNYLFLVDVGGGKRIEVKAFQPCEYPRRRVECA